MISMPFQRCVGPISAPPPLAIAKLVGNSHKNATQSFVAAPSLKAPVHSFVVRIALRQHVPLRPCVEYRQDRFKHAPRRNRFPSRMPVGNVLLRKMIPDALPLLVAQPNRS